ncbi:thioredoxin family protein [Candidatus Poribacteria bacterium]|nr:thioredoxin family protein [Candidatus Poribacteria bacterium]
MLTIIFACERKNVKNNSISSDISSEQLQSPEVNELQGPESAKSEDTVKQTSPIKESQNQKKLPRLVDLGADKCIPCKMMAPIIEELKEEYAGKLEVEFIDVWKDPGAGKQYGIHVIPTQIFYDTDGKEFNRHVGYISKENILAVFQQKGIKIDG